MRKASNRILADGVSVSNNTWETGLANNDLVVGPTGGGKTRGYVLPNLLNSQESFLVTDSKGRCGSRWEGFWRGGASRCVKSVLQTFSIPSGAIIP